MFDMFLISQNTAAVICDDQPSVFDRNYVSGGKKKCCVFVSTQTKNKKMHGTHHGLFIQGFKPV